jgi:hypothetical protein
MPSRGMAEPCERVCVLTRVPQVAHLEKTGHYLTVKDNQIVQVCVARSPVDIAILTAPCAAAPPVMRAAIQARVGALQ